MLNKMLSNTKRALPGEVGAKSASSSPIRKALHPP